MKEVDSDGSASSKQNLEVLEALRGANLLVSVGIRNEDLAGLSSSQDAANSWVNTYIVPYNGNILIRWISLGNEVIPGPLSTYVASAMNNIYKALVSVGLSNIKVSTVVPGSVLGTSYPPSQGSFSSEVAKVMNFVVSFLSSTSSPIGKPNVTIIVSESGWPSAGNEPHTSIENGHPYNANLRKHVNSLGSQGTPRQPGLHLDTFLFAMFNENLKPAGAEQHFGLFYPNMEPVYPLP
ncbi:hypothetical protein HHK36_008937 [Tetracentron sinense]|uniref:Glucan endo-1,3-beta-D-glucosidase n=1 Tax=Tetracentron sinense TaxID=13715 RepID=A0A834ZC65_TETSI|nr:hypothetical protein HHK36_008937 [Tetracentron sinense]